MKYLIIALLVGLSWASFAQKKSKEEAPFKFYEGPTLATSEIVTLKCLQDKKLSVYFQSIDGKTLPIQEANEKITHIQIAPGKHKVKVRFTPKKKVTTSAESFEEVDFKKGETYYLKSEYTPGTGDYPTSAFTSRLKLWIENDSVIISEQLVNGMGESVVGN